ncbi:3-deoxy-manno-octulosonate cytidylyltransferase [compost metagenome]
MVLKTVAIVQARMGSTRLPGKVMNTIKDKTVLGHVIARLKKVKEIDEIVIATTKLSQDDIIEKEAHLHGVSVYRGSEQDVLARYYEAACEYQANHIVRITSDCPLIDPGVTSKIVDFYLNHSFDYVSNCIVRSYPRGLDTEVFSYKSLERASKETTLQEQREHVTPYIYQNRSLFSVYDFIGEHDHSYYRWTVDTIEDFKLVSAIYDELYEEDFCFGWDKTLELMKQNPTLSLINSHIEQKKI